MLRKEAEEAIVDALTNDCKVDIRACTVIAFRPRAEYQNLLDVRMTAEDILQFPDDCIAESKLHFC